MVSGAPQPQSQPGPSHDHGRQHDYGVSTINPRWAQRAPLGGNGAGPTAPTLAPGQVHLWMVDTKDLLQAPITESTEAADTSSLTLLSAAELARGERRLDPAQRALYLGGRIGMRILLRAYTGLANDALRLGSGARGKPALLNPLPGGELCFNYTLSGGRALYALAWNRQVGIDMETLPRKINAARLARRKLAAVEQRTWRALPAKQRDVAMLACWTRKEAYGKALGVGIRYAINQAPLFVGIHSPAWQCAVRGLFDAPGQAGDVNDVNGAGPNHEQILHGLQLALPFPGIAALVHDGAALPTPADGVSLQAWQWAPHAIQQP